MAGGPKTNHNPPELRLERRFHLIERHLAKIESLGSLVILWQVAADGTRILSKGQVQELNAKTEMIFFRGYPGNHQVFDLDQPIYFYSEFLNVIFKTKAHFSSDKMTRLQFPDEIKVEELRKSPRKRMKQSLINNLLFDKYNSTSKQIQNYAVKVLDISESGVSIIANSNQAMDLQLGEGVLIRELCHGILETAITAHIVYVRPLGVNMEIKSINAYRVGIHFNQGHVVSNRTNIN